ncbi:hypothetical protein LJB90_00325 [Eubacteriales bacterium OttesenSCG-928-G02]|nr:hypothetical protein [Eubacteriales bacterium OttesenSCG-928-G02]
MKFKLMKILIIILSSIVVLSSCKNNNSVSIEENLNNSNNDSFNSNGEEAPDHIFYTFNTYGHNLDEKPVNSEPLAYFVDFIKNNGSAKIHGKAWNEYSYNKLFLDWVKTQNAIPIIKNKDNKYFIDGIQVIHSQAAYYIVFDEKVDDEKTYGERFILHVFTLNDNEKNNSLNSLFKEKLFKEKADNINSINKSTSKFGECLSIDYEKTKEGIFKNFTATTFKYGDYLIHISLHGKSAYEPWDNAYFDLFDIVMYDLKR